MLANGTEEEGEVHYPIEYRGNHNRLRTQSQLALH